MPSTLDIQQAQVVDTERTRVEDALVRTARPVLLAALLEYINSLMGFDGAKPLLSVATTAAQRLEPAIFDGMMAAYLTGRQRSFLTAAVVDQHLAAGSPSIVVHTQTPAHAPRIVSPSGVREAVADGRSIIKGDGIAPSRSKAFPRPTFAPRPRPRQPVTVGGGGFGPSGGSSGGGSGAGRVAPPSGGSGGAPRPMSVNQLAAKFHRERLALTDTQIQALARNYGQVAKNVANQVGNEMHKAATRIAGELIETPLSTKDPVSFIRARLTSAGFAPARPHVIETIYRTSVQMAYNAGQMQMDSDPAVDIILWGYRYSAEMDDRTTDLCRDLQGMTRPKDDPVWQILTPPNHYNCRSALIPIFKGNPEAQSTIVPPFSITPAFAANWGRVLSGA